MLGHRYSHLTLHADIKYHPQIVVYLEPGGSHRIDLPIIFLQVAVDST